MRWESRIVKNSRRPRRRAASPPDRTSGRSGASALTADIAVPTAAARRAASGIPATYVPARNTVFRSYGLAWRRTWTQADIFVGVNALDYSGYPDCRPEHILAFEAMAKLPSSRRRGTVAIGSADPHDKGRDHPDGHELGVDYRLTDSLLRPDAQGRACGSSATAGPPEEGVPAKPVSWTDGVWRLGL